jgi:hypothetical protein
MLRRRFEREAVRDGSGGGSTAPAAETSILQDVQSLISDIERPGGEASPSENPAPAAPAAPAAAAPAAPKPATPAAAPTTPPAQEFYSDEQLAAFDGEYDRRDFDWNKVPPELRSRLKILESGTGKARARLEARVRAELAAEGRGSTNQPTPVAQPIAQPPAQQVDPKAAWSEFINAETPEAGLSAFSKLLQTDQGKQMLAAAGYTDPTERAVVSEIVEDRVIQNGLIEAQEDFPALTQDPTFTQEVQALISQSPKAVAALKSRNPAEAAEVFRVASARVVQARQGAREQALTAREAALNAREQAIAAKENGLQQQIEATNRTETAQNVSVGGGGQSNAGAPKDSSILDDVRELGQKHGMFQR